MPHINGDVWKWLAGLLSGVVLGLVVYTWNTSGGITQNALATAKGRIDAHAQWIEKHEDWAQNERHVILDSIRTVAEQSTINRIESWQRFGVLFETQQLIMDELKVPKYLRPVMPAAPDTTQDRESIQ